MNETGRRRVLFLAQSVVLDEVAPNGSGAHGAATLEGLRAHFDVVAVGAERANQAPISSRANARRFAPGWVRGLRQDIIAIRRDRAFARRALAAVGTRQPDVVYGRNEYMALAPLRVAAALGVPAVLEVNGLLAKDVKTMYRSPLEPLGVWRERAKLRRAAAVVTVSPGLARLLKKQGAHAERMFVVPNSVAPERVSDGSNVTAGDRVVVGWVGHVMRWHLRALELLVEAAPAVVRRADVRFLVIGSGPGLPELEARVRASELAPRFTFAGSVPFEDVPTRLRDVDIGVIPAVFDYGFPVKLVEFGAAGLPVVAPRSPSLDEQLIAGEEYLPFTPGDAVALAEALVGLAVDPARRRRLGDALHRAVRDRYTWDATGRQLAAAIEDSIARRLVTHAG